MTLIFCLDDQKGMMFFGKRQSRDSLLCEKILEISHGKRLYMSSYSAKLFSDHSCVTVDDAYMSKAQPGDICFIENGDFDPDKADAIILCHWNRRYQADRFFTHDLNAEGFRRVKKEDIIGSSHKKITIEFYER